MNFNWLLIFIYVLLIPMWMFPVEFVPEKVNYWAEKYKYRDEILMLWIICIFPIIGIIFMTPI